MALQMFRNQIGVTGLNSAGAQATVHVLARLQVWHIGPVKLTNTTQWQIKNATSERGVIYGKRRLAFFSTSAR